ncbi:MAG: hypothetical protein R2754_01905 [Microthrixaceae bacterium]
MLDSVVIEVAVGLALVFLVLATLTSALTEVVAKVFQLRARTLWKSLEGLLGARAAAASGGAAGGPAGLDLGDLGLTAGLRMVTLRDDPRPKADTVISDESILLDDLAATPSIRAFDPAASTSKRTRVDSIPPKVFAAALLELAEIKGQGGSVEDRVRVLVAQYPGVPLLSYLGTVAGAAGEDVDRFVDLVGGWFDAQMTRLTAIYKRYATWILFAVGLVLAVVLQADAIEMGVALRDNAETRTAVALLADDITDDGVIANCKDAVPKDADNRDLRCAGRAVGDLNELGIPILGNYPDSWDEWTTGWTGDGAPGFLLRGFGVLVTAAALAMGAPFWFDLLGLLTGKRRE